MASKKKQAHKNGHKSATEQMNDLAIAHVNSNPELLVKIHELMEVEWRTVKIPAVAPMTVVWAGFSDKVVMVEVAVDDAFAKRLMKEYLADGKKPGKPEEK